MGLRLHVIISSTRPTRVGPTVARWFEDVARQDAGFDVHLVDLAEVGLPLYDEPRHPRLQQYEHDHTRRWSESVAAADAFVLVTPEYNHSPTPALINALDFVYDEWGYKPAAFVSYGGISGGLRAVQATKTVLAALRVVPIVESVTIPRVSQQVTDGRFVANEAQTKSAQGLLRELRRWAEALKPLRDGRI